MPVIDERSHMLTRDIIERLYSEHVLFLNYICRDIELTTVLVI